MDTVLECYNKIVALKGVVPHSEICDAPKDIDVFVPRDVMQSACLIAIGCNFVQMKSSERHNVFLKYSDSKLYILDLFSDFNIICESVYNFSVSEKGNIALGNDPVLHKDFKTLVLKKSKDGCYRDKDKLMCFFKDKGNYISNSNLQSKDNISEITREILKFSFFSQNFYRIKSHKKVRKNGLSIAFLGPDGSGKTYIINLLRLGVRSKVQYMGDWFFGFQPIYSFLAKIPTPFNRFLYAFYFVENLIRRLKVYLYQGLGYVVLIDRFPGTNRGSMQTGILKYLNKAAFLLTPKPDLFVILSARPEVVFSRKQELSIEEIKKIQDGVVTIVSNYRCFVFNPEFLDDELNALLGFIYKK